MHDIGNMHQSTNNYVVMVTIFDVSASLEDNQSITESHRSLDNQLSTVFRRFHSSAAAAAALEYNYT